MGESLHTASSECKFELVPCTKFIVCALGRIRRLGSLHNSRSPLFGGCVCLLSWILNHPFFVFPVRKKHCRWRLPQLFQIGVRNSFKIQPFRFWPAQEFRQNVLEKKVDIFPGFCFTGKFKLPGWSEPLWLSPVTASLISSLRRIAPLTWRPCGTGVWKEHSGKKKGNQ